MRRARHASLVAVAGAIIACAAGTSRAARSDAPPESLEAVVQLLKGEAREAWASGTLPREHSNVGDEYDVPIDEEVLRGLLVRRIDRDGFVDAYVRWQLLSYGPVLLALEDNEYRRLLQTAPAFVPNHL